jgi:antitoxin CptB
LAADDLLVKRLRWRCRRGLLENDLIFTRFFDQHENTLTSADVGALACLLDLPDNDLLDLLLARTEPAESLDSAAIKSLLTRLRAA